MIIEKAFPRTPMVLESVEISKASKVMQTKIEFNWAMNSKTKVHLSTLSVHDSDFFSIQNNITWTLLVMDLVRHAMIMNATRNLDVVLVKYCVPLVFSRE